jgi:hypothetical protein
VDFFPWLTDTVLAMSPEISAALPSEIQLSAYPNPFNNSTTLQLSVHEPAFYIVELYNTLGQRVQELWSGHIFGQKQISVNGTGMSSGIYFVRVQAQTRNHVTALAKVVLLK